jgi:glycosyltransferase involved in cell wall biosynthesis
MWTTIIFDLVTTLFVGTSIAWFINLRWAHRLPSLEHLAAGGESRTEKPIRCSVVIAARDEAARVEQTLRHLLAQRGVDAEFIVVDDRSADGTGDIVARFAKDDPRVQLKRVDVLPEGWLGKCHACHVGASAATGDWILFTDADCWLKPDVIARALRVAERDKADHVTMAAGTVLESTAARAWYLLFLTGLAAWMAGVNRDRPKSHIGVGAFNLVRADAYRQCGGYEALRLTVVDDIKLGLLLRRAGKRTRAFIGGDDVECHWGKTVASMVKIMEKNYFAAIDYRLGVAAAGSLAVVLISAILFWGLISGTAAGLVAAGSIFVPVLPTCILAKRVGWSWPCAVLAPFMFPVFFYALLNSTFVALRNGGIRWRETFYPLASLRAGNVQ